MIAPVQPDGKRQHKGGNRYRYHDACQYQAAGNGIDVGLRALNAVYDDRSHAAVNISLFSEKKVDCRIHDVQADDFLDQIRLQEQVAESDAEENHGNCLTVVYE